MSDHLTGAVLNFTTQIVTAYLSNNEITAEALPPLINSVYRSLSATSAQEPLPVATRVPAVQVKKSVFSDFIICLENGKKLKTLKRHLQTSYGLTPDAYRVKWGLPPDYPMVAPNYAATRAMLAKQTGLGRKPLKISADPDVTKLPARHARGAKW